MAAHLEEMNRSLALLVSQSPRRAMRTGVAGLESIARETSGEAFAIADCRLPI